jgi:hypothetical protein
VSGGAGVACNLATNPDIFQDAAETTKKFEAGSQNLQIAGQRSQQALGAVDMPDRSAKPADVSWQKAPTYNLDRNEADSRRPLSLTRCSNGPMRTIGISLAFDQ